MDLYKPVYNTHQQVAMTTKSVLMLTIGSGNKKFFIVPIAVVPRQAESTDTLKVHMDVFLEELGSPSYKYYDKRLNAK